MLTLKLGAMVMKVSPPPTASGPSPGAGSRPSTSPHASTRGFATDFMPTAVALTAVSCGSAIINENLSTVGRVLR